MYDIIVLSGGFDPVHKGHVRMIQAAAENCNFLIVGVNSDDWLRRKKGKEFMGHDERKEIISAFRGVDEVMSFNDDDNSASDLIKKVRLKNPDRSIAFGNGGDRVHDNVPEVQTCLEANVEMIWNVGGGKIQSSSELIKNSHLR
tara:strand:+ start:969 stop:1400 length:432 start_codon:yes stop_codon:yes gene_type:complete